MDFVHPQYVAWNRMRPKSIYDSFRLDKMCGRDPPTWLEGVPFSFPFTKGGTNSNKDTRAWMVDSGVFPWAQKGQISVKPIQSNLKI